jgi:hypothetical protein
VAALNRDVSALERLWSDQFVVNAPNNQVVVGRQQNLDTFVRGGVINFSSFERTIEFIRVDGNFGVLMGTRNRGSAHRRTECGARRGSGNSPAVHEHLEERRGHVATILAPCERH